MGINYSIDAKARIVRLAYAGEADIEELASTFRAIFRSTDYRRGFGFVVDRHSLGPPTMVLFDILAGFVTLQRGALEGSRWALVVSDPADLTANKTAGVFDGSRWPVRARRFREIDEAEAWLRETDPLS